MKRKLIVVVGPTAVGKSEVGVALAVKLGGEIVSCDSRQVYKYMDIGTAKPTPEERKKIAHHMIDVLSPDVSYSAGQFAEEARKEIELIFRNGKRPILVGGSGMYIRALIDGLFPGPPRDETVRGRLRKEADQHNPDYLHKRLEGVDPVTASRLHVNDRQRIIRALEVYELTGRAISELQRENASTPYEVVMIGIARARRQIYDRIGVRVASFFRDGFVEEVKGLLEMGYGAELPSMKTLGYKEVVAFLAGDISMQKTVDDICRNTRHFAKQQRTWFRADSRIRWIEIGEGESGKEVAERIECSVEMAGIWEDVFD